MSQAHFTDEQMVRISARLGRELDAWLRDRNVEPHYSVGTLAELLEVSERAVWGYVEDYERSGGREGIGPFVKISHKVVRVPASAVRRFLAAKTIDASALSASPEREAA